MVIEFIALTLSVANRIATMISFSYHYTQWKSGQVKIHAHSKSNTEWQCDVQMPIITIVRSKMLVPFVIAIPSSPTSCKTQSYLHTALNIYVWFSFSWFQALRYQSNPETPISLERHFTAVKLCHKFPVRSSYVRTRFGLLLVGGNDGKWRSQRLHWNAWYVHTGIFKRLIKRPV